MRKLLAGILGLSILFLAMPLTAAPVGTSDQEVKAVAEPILENLLAGFNQGNYAQYSKNFDETLREAIPEEKFQQVRRELMKKLGSFKSKNYLGFLNQQAHTVVLWKGAFTDTQDDVLLKLVLSKRQDKVVVKGLWFQ
ncbi:MAG: DUF3887 domain-containing protein [Desulfobaccales bacterium]